MEIAEIISYRVDLKSNILDISFRLMEDDDETVREDRIDFSDAEEYGYELLTEDIDVFEGFFTDEDDYKEENYDDDAVLDEDELLSFLNEYYTINPKNLPKPISGPTLVIKKVMTISSPISLLGHTQRIITKV